ncbi:hypothetical protein ABZ746_29735 [Streptomyces sp. NPDC020096]
MRTMRLATALLVGAASVISLTAPVASATDPAAPAARHHRHHHAHIKVHPRVAWSGERVHVRVRCPRVREDDRRTIKAYSEAFRRDHITLHRDGIFRDREHRRGENDRREEERLYVGSGKVEYRHFGHRREADRDDRWGGWIGPRRHHHHRHHRRHRRHFIITGRCPRDGFFRTHIQVIERRHHRRHHHHRGGGYGGGFGGGYNGGGFNNGGNNNGGNNNGGRRSAGNYPSASVRAGEGGSVNNGNALETGAGGALAAAAVGGGAWALRRRRTGE